MDRRDARRAWLRTMLEQRGIEVHDVSSGWEALTLLAEDLPYGAVILGETRAPDAHGFVAMSRQAGLEVPFLLITPTEDDPLGARLRRLGWAVVVREPLDAEAFVAGARRLWEARS